MRLLQDWQACKETTHTYTQKLTFPYGLYVHGVREDADVPDDEWLPFWPDTCSVHVTRLVDQGHHRNKLTVSLRGWRVTCRRTGELGSTRMVRHEAYGWTDVFGGTALGDWWPTPLGEAPTVIRCFAHFCYLKHA